MERPKAKERQGYKASCAKFTQLDKGKTRDKVGAAIGMSGVTYQKVEALIRDDAEALTMYREAMKHQGERASIVYNVNEVGRPVGNSRAYTLSRLQREAAIAQKPHHSDHRADDERIVEGRQDASWAIVVRSAREKPAGASAGWSRGWLASSSRIRRSVQ